jgi:hypothetical protein
MKDSPSLMPKSDLVLSMITLLKGKRFKYSTERELQDGIEIVLRDASVAYEREYALGPGDVIDFLVHESIGLEVKISGSPVEVARQLLRYAGQPKVSHIMLVTGKLRLGHLPAELLGKPVSVVSLWKGFLS